MTMTDEIDRIRDLIISLSRSWHPSREQVQRIVDAAQGVENVMQAPHASGMMEEALEAAARPANHGRDLIFWVAQAIEECANVNLTLEDGGEGEMEPCVKEGAGRFIWRAAENAIKLAGYAVLPTEAALPHLTEAKDAEIERLRRALTDIITRSETGTLGTSKVVDMRHIARAALGDAT